MLGRFGRWRWVLLGLSLLLLLLFLAPFADCFCRDRWIVSEGPAPDAFKVLPGKIGVTLTAGYQSEYRGEVRRLQFQGGDVLRVESLPAATESPPGPSSTADLLPQISDLTSGQPYTPSGDGRFAAVRTSDDEGLYRYHLDHRFAIPHDASVLVIVDLIARREVARVDSGFRWRIEDLAWSPDGRYVAIFRMEAEFGFCFREAYFFAHGMPTQLLTYYLDVYDLTGRLIASQKLLSRSLHWFGEIVWTE